MNVSVVENSQVGLLILTTQKTVIKTQRSIEMENNNWEYIETLKSLIRFFETHPELPIIKAKSFYYSLNSKAELLQAAKGLHSFTKSVDDYNYNLNKKVGDLSLQFYTRRSEICEKVVTWVCPEEGLLESYNSLQEKE